MKKNLGVILAIALSLSALLLTVTFQAGWVQAKFLEQETRAETAPTIVSYQGQIWDGADPFDGTGYFKFAIVNDRASVLWSNDGELPEPFEPIHLPVVNGLFSVNLGDTSIGPEMDQALTAKVFVDPLTFLRVWFSETQFGTYTQLPDQPIASVPYALRAESANSSVNSLSLGGVAAVSYQLRVTGSCPVGSAVRAINSGGTVVCETLAASPTFSLSTIDSTGYVGKYSSMAIGTDGLGLISYWDETNGDLKVAHCADTNCSSATSYTLDSTGNVGQYTSIAIGTDGFGLISYQDVSNSDLKVAHCSNTFCSSATSYTLDSVGIVGIETSIAIGTDGFGLISYFDDTDFDLNVAHCSNTLCSSASRYTLDSAGVVGLYTSIAIGADGFGLISYFDSTNGNLKVAHCSVAVCSSATVSTLDSTDHVGIDTSITIGRDGLGLISYVDLTNDKLKVAHCENTTCTSATTTSLNSGEPYGGALSSITIGIDGYGVISYFVLPFNELRIAHCVNVGCTDATVYTLDTTYSIAAGTSITIGEDGYPLISYNDGINRDLKVAHCSNELCIPINWEH